MKIKYKTTGKLCVVGFGESVDDQDSRGDNSSTGPCGLGPAAISTHAGCPSLHRWFCAQTQTLVHLVIGRLSVR